MADTHDGRRAQATITYDKVDISEEIRQSLISISVTLNADGETSDDVTISMHDRERNWIGPWYPKVKVKPAEDKKSAKATDSSDDDTGAGDD